jgi:hypothetical protein
MSALQVDACAKLVRALGDCGFLFNPLDFSDDKRLRDQRETEGLVAQTDFWIKVAEKVAVPVIAASLGVDAPPSLKFKPSLKLEFDAEAMDDELDELRTFADLVCFKYAYSQPVVVAVVIDGYGNDPGQYDSSFQQFDAAMLEFRKFTSSMKAGFGNVKMSVTGIILWCFFESERAKRFAEGPKERLRKMHFWSKVNSLSWVVDLEKHSLTKHQGLPWILGSLFDGDTFVKSLSRDV